MKFKVTIEIASRPGEVVVYGNNQIIAYGGMLSNLSHQIEGENELRIFNFSIKIQID